MLNLDIFLSNVHKTKEMYLNKLDAIDNQYSSNAINAKKSKSIEKLKVYKEWANDLVRSLVMSDETIDKVKQLIHQSKKDVRKNGEQLNELRDDLESVKKELQHDDSGIGEMLTATTNMENHHIHFERRSIELSEAIDKSSRELDQLSEQLTKLNDAQAAIHTEYAEFLSKLNQLTIEVQQISD